MLDTGVWGVEREVEVYSLSLVDKLELGASLSAVKYEFNYFKFQNLKFVTHFCFSQCINMHWLVT